LVHILFLLLLLLLLLLPSYLYLEYYLLYLLYLLLVASSYEKQKLQVLVDGPYFRSPLSLYHLFLLLVMEEIAPFQLQLCQGKVAEGTLLLYHHSYDKVQLVVAVAVVVVEVVLMTMMANHHH
jgi:hypothetical protein